MKKFLRFIADGRADRWLQEEEFYNQMNQLINLKGELSGIPPLRRKEVTLRKSVTSSRSVLCRCSNNGCGKGEQKWPGTRLS
jgi:hypothetical protein